MAVTTPVCKSTYFMSIRKTTSCTYIQTYINITTTTTITATTATTITTTTDTLSLRQTFFSRCTTLLIRQSAVAAQPLHQ
ncbi:hypothetical protein N7510_008565 [Penicillium lagena]|uniref:uncharacterized protein n=1 Tax=Penicillium lagena TaxID=94218 RepID=UPI00253F655B|nr:uncharacterized protein N7510_008565 [Penicillium lagena]KAJ5605784.1 hypothetical protein N7510_008565 [Penicillium lagena]